MPTDCFIKLAPISVTETIIEVIAAGPANNGIANGNILILSERLLRLSGYSLKSFSFYF